MKARHLLNNQTETDMNTQTTATTTTLQGDFDYAGITNANTAKLSKYSWVLDTISWFDEYKVLLSGRIFTLVVFKNGSYELRVTNPIGLRAKQGITFTHTNHDLDFNEIKENRVLTSKDIKQINKRISQMVKMFA